MLHVFLLNPYAGSKNFSGAIREELKKISDIEYFVFNILYKDHEYELVKQIMTYLEGNDIRIYVCGGSGTLHKVINGLYNIGKLSEVEVAWLAMGNNNSFIRSLKGDLVKMTDLRAVIRGYVIPCDYILTNHAIALNAMSMGVDASFVEYRKSLLEIGVKDTGLLGYIGSVYAVIRRRFISAKLRCDGLEEYSTFDEIFFGNGSFLGNNFKLANHAKQNDGLANYNIMYASKLKGLRKLSILRAVKRHNMKKLEKATRMGLADKIEVDSDINISVNLDGELYTSFNYWKAEIIKEGIKLVLPKGVTFHE